LKSRQSLLYGLFANVNAFQHARIENAQYYAVMTLLIRWHLLL
jgi:hypothetical protein